MTPAQEKMAKVMLERTLQDAVIERAQALGLRIWHDEDSRRNRAGLPDCIIIGPGGVLWAELKSHKGRIRPAQTQFLTDLQNAGQHVVVWKPQHLFNGAIDRSLALLAR